MPRSSSSSSARAMLADLSPILLPRPRPIPVNGPVPTSSTAGDGIEHLEGGNMLGHIVDPENRRSIRRRREIGGERANDTGVDWLRALFGKQGFARNADKDRQTIVLEGGQICEDGKILHSAFAKANAGIENEAGGGNPRVPGKTQRLVEEAAHVRDNIAVGIGAFV